MPWPARLPATSKIRIDGRRFGLVASMVTRAIPRFTAMNRNESVSLGLITAPLGTSSMNPVIVPSPVAVSRRIGVWLLSVPFWFSKSSMPFSVGVAFITSS